MFFKLEEEFAGQEGQVQNLDNPLHLPQARPPGNRRSQEQRPGDQPSPGAAHNLQSRIKSRVFAVIRMRPAGGNQRKVILPIKPPAIKRRRNRGAKNQFQIRVKERLINRKIPETMEPRRLPGRNL